MIPIKDNLSCKVFPTVTLLLIALNAFGFFIELALPSGELDAFLQQWALVPSSFFHAFSSGSPSAMAMALLTMVTASFLHGGWMHIIGNMLFLQAFGRAVEARLGAVRFAIYYLLSCFAAWGMFAFTDPTSHQTALGASGAIAAVLGAYLVFYPKAEFKIIMMVGPFPAFMIVWAWVFLGIWGGLQLISGYGSVVNPANADSVAYWAHIGGFLYGMIVAGAVAFLKPVSDICYVPISCNCTCGGPCKKHGKHRFQFIRFWKFWASKQDDCDHDHDHGDKK